MKATGIIRRIDDLGRVVIPKEIRKTLNIREGDPLEIYRIDDGVVFKPYKEQTSAEFAEEWLMKNKLALKRTKAKFAIDDTTITCEVIVDNDRCTGVAKCNPSDVFNPSVGMAIAWFRAMYATVPSELL